MPHRGSFDNECTPEANSEASLQQPTKHKTQGLGSFKPEPIIPIIEIADTENISDHSQVSLGHCHKTNHSQERTIQNQSIQSFTQASDQSN